MSNVEQNETARIYSPEDYPARISVGQAPVVSPSQPVFRKQCGCTLIQKPEALQGLGKGDPISRITLFKIYCIAKLLSTDLRRWRAIISCQSVLSATRHNILNGLHIHW